MNEIRTNQPCFEGGWGDEKLVDLIWNYFQSLIYCKTMNYMINK